MTLLLTPRALSRLCGGGAGLLSRAAARARRRAERGRRSDRAAGRGLRRRAQCRDRRAASRSGRAASSAPMRDRRRLRARRRGPRRRQCEPQPRADRRRGCGSIPARASARTGSASPPTPSGFVKVPQLGRVIIGDDVEIGANTTIDRGAGPDTVIGAGTMIDNLVQIGHNVQIGRGCVLVAQVGISGSTRLGDFVMIGGQGGLDRPSRRSAPARASRRRPASCATSPPGETVLGSPAVPIREHHPPGRCCCGGWRRKKASRHGRRRRRRRRGEIDIQRIMQMIPHRYPFLMIDRVVDVIRGASARPASRTSRSTSAISRAISRSAR